MSLSLWLCKCALAGLVQSDAWDLVKLFRYIEIWCRILLDPGRYTEFEWEPSHSRTLGTPQKVRICTAKGIEYEYSKTHPILRLIKVPDYLIFNPPSQLPPRELFRSPNFKGTLAPPHSQNALPSRSRPLRRDGHYRQRARDRQEGIAGVPGGLHQYPSRRPVGPGMLRAPIPPAPHPGTG